MQEAHLQGVVCSTWNLKIATCSIYPFVVGLGICSHLLSLSPHKSGGLVLQTLFCHHRIHSGNEPLILKSL